MTYLKINDAS